MPRFALPLLLAFISMGLGAGCGSKIGDSCTAHADCGQDGDRVCDQTQPGGYCTIEGCDWRSCPDEAVCIRFFAAQHLERPCDPQAEDVLLPDGGVADDQCAPYELCLPSGLCAPVQAERRYCAATCGGDDDCRSGYACVEAGGTNAMGAIGLTRNPDAKVRFCAPR